MNDLHRFAQVKSTVTERTPCFGLNVTSSVSISDGSALTSESLTKIRPLFCSRIGGECLIYQIFFGPAAEQPVSPRVNQLSTDGFDSQPRFPRPNPAHLIETKAIFHF